MALKRKITKAEFDALNEVLKPEYVVKGDGYVLDTDDAAELLTAKQKEVDEHKGTKAERDRLQSELDTLKNEVARKSGDFGSIEQSYKDKLTAAEKERDDARAETSSVVKSLTVDKLAAEISQMSTVPSLFLPVVAQRLTAEIIDGKAVVRVMGADGKPTAATIDDLKKELASIPEYKHIIKAGSQASGSATPPTNGGSAPFNGQQQGTPKSFSDMKPADLVNQIKQSGFTGE